MEKIKIEIKNRFTGAFLFEYEKEDNTIKDTVVEAVKNDAYLGCADLGCADLGCADLRDADLRGAYLGCADLGGADLRDADLRGADLRGAYLRGADLGGADLRGVKNVPFIPMVCPTDGDFIGWKKVKYGEKSYLVKLMVPADAKRCSATGRKCRCSKALVLDISLLVDGKEAGKEKNVINNNYVPTLYEVGKVVEPDNFDEDRFSECSHGIHFFIDRQEAINY